MGGSGKKRELYFFRSDQVPAATQAKPAAYKKTVSLLGRLLNSSENWEVADREEFTPAIRSTTPAINNPIASGFLVLFISGGSLVDCRMDEVLSHLR